MRGPWATIRLNALKHNLARIKAATPHSKILAMVKSNAYGHGAIRVASALAAADGFGVASLADALTLRNAGIKHRLLLLAGCFSIEELNIAAQQQLDIVIHSNYQIQMLERAHLPQPLSVWLKLNSGMNRLGFPPSETHTTYQRLSQCANVKQPLHLMAHLADADNLDKPTTTTQLNAFKQVTDDLAGPKSIANSAGIIAWPNTHTDWVRPGIMLYGISPFANQAGHQHGLQPVMTLTARLIAINDVSKNAYVGYGGTWQCATDTKIGIVAIGYGDGYSRHAANGTPVLINGQQCKLIGRVSMDMLAVDLTDCASATIGDTVTLWGDDLPIETIARHCNTIAYQLTCQLTARVQFLEE